MIYNYMCHIYSAWCNYLW